jgi:hypothetical protein
MKMTGIISVSAISGGGRSRVCTTMPRLRIGDEDAPPRHGIAAGIPEMPNLPKLRRRIASTLVPMFLTGVMNDHAAPRRAPEASFICVIL